MAIIKILPTDLQLAKQLIYDQCNFDFAYLKFNSESVDYGACTFELNKKNILYRVSKITPTKTGQFVTIWKRNKEGITVPFDTSDEIDFVIIAARRESDFGQFIFPKQVLADKGIISQNGKSGKRGIRVYPPWDIAENKQAKKTQSWQIQYFLTIQSDDSFDLNLAKQLFASIS